ncbi:FG-GAP-like repeat-containing protein [Streptomyces sp. NPDC002265]|uniref:FG-GAP-like repeat-containing protein n=1 Tax=Streptomyces sp. NPDC002265 TaxID=3154415 RepID=UPI00331FBC8C
MHLTRPTRLAALAAALIAVPLAAAALPARAVTGTPDTGTAYAFSVRLDIGHERACSGALVDPNWIVTAASCFVDDPAAGLTVPPGPPAIQTFATIGRPDLSTTAGQVVEVTELVPRTDRDLVMAKLAEPVTAVAPVAVTTTAPSAGEQLRVAGFGRTKDEWAPLALHTGAFSVGAVGEGTLDLAAAGDAAVCKGDTGGPALRESGGKVELVAINSRSWQGGCFGQDPAETRTGAVETRLDDINTWIQQVRAVPQASQTTSGDFNGDGKQDVAVFFDNGISPEGKSRASIYTFLSNGTGFNAPRLAWSTPGGFTWSISKLTSGDYNGDGKDDIGVFYDGGSSSTGNISSVYTFTSNGTGFNAPKKVWTTTGGFTWGSSKVTSGDYNGDGKDDIGVFYNGGSSSTGNISSVYTFTSSGDSMTVRKAWTTTGGFTWGSSKVTSGDFNGDGKDDVGVLYNGGTSADGKAISSLYTFTSDGTDMTAAKVWTSTGSFSWSASKLTSGDYSGDGKDDIGILYNTGTSADGVPVSSLYTATSSASGIGAPQKVWTSSTAFDWNAGQLTSGDYNGDKKADLGVLYDLGQTADGRRINALYSFRSTGTSVQAPVQNWSGSVS